MNSLQVGLTGGIGSGKSTVANFFKNILNIPVYFADDRAKFLVNHNDFIISSILNNFGNNAYLNGVYNKPFISSIVFNDKDKLSILNDIIHPIVQQDYYDWLDKYKNAPYTIKEAAIMIEANVYQELDLLILVSANTTVKINRVMNRDSLLEEDVLNRMSKQMSDFEKREFVNKEILNNDNNKLIPQILKIHKFLINR